MSNPSLSSKCYFISIGRTVFRGFLFAIMVLFNCCNVKDDAVPALDNILPNKASAGKTVTITGRNFSVTATDNIVEFNGVSATVSSSTAATIVVKVPTGAATGKVTVTVNGKGKTQSAADFIVDVDDCSTCGFIEKFALSNGYTFQPSYVSEAAKSATTQGINFTVDKKIRLKSIGGLFRKTGTYPMEIQVSADRYVLYSTTITVADTQNFVFQDVTSDIQLTPGTEYELRYCSVNHDSDYEMFPPTWSPNFLQPFDFGDVNMTSLFLDINGCTQPGNSSAEQRNDVFMRGIVDFKYEVVE